MVLKVKYFRCVKVQFYFKISNYLFSQQLTTVFQALNTLKNSYLTTQTYN
jgi:hypothetical protein